MTPTRLVKLPAAPCYAVIFSSQRLPQDHGYAAMADRMLELAAQQPGFLGLESARGADGFGITVSYWKTRTAIAKWRAHAEHKLAQQHGKSLWYGGYAVRVARVERAYDRE